MTPKPIIYSHHAKGRLTGRGVRRAEVRWLIAQGIPMETEPPYQLRRGYLGKREAAVLYVESATRILIVTVMWLGEKGGGA